MVVLLATILHHFDFPVTVVVYLKLSIKTLTLNVKTNPLWTIYAIYFFILFITMIKYGLKKQMTGD